jgi:hypothetical protein
MVKKIGVFPELENDPVSHEVGLGSRGLGFP